MKYETATIASLMLDPANVRTHDSKNLESIKASLARFGQQKPIVVNSKGIIVAGNGTMMAAKMLNWSSVEIVRTNLEGAEAIAYAIADNRTAELAGWDEVALAQQLAELQLLDDSLVLVTGFDLPDETSTEFIEHSLCPPPKLAWVLVGIDISRYIEISNIVEKLSAIDGVIIETQLTDEEDG